MRTATARLLQALLALWALGAGAPTPGGQTFDMQHSSLTVQVHKQGLFSFLADNHTIDAPITSSNYDPARRSVEVTVDAARMRVLDPHLAADKRAQVQANMLGPQVLDVTKYPTITFVSTQIDGNGAGKWTVSGNLTLHGQTHPLTLGVQSDGNGHFTGSATIRQTAYGITPIKIAGGAVSVKDDVSVDISVSVPAR